MTVPRRDMVDAIWAATPKSASLMMPFSESSRLPAWLRVRLRVRVRLRLRLRLRLRVRVRVREQVARLAGRGGV